MALEQNPLVPNKWNLKGGLDLLIFYKGKIGQMMVVKFSCSNGYYFITHVTLTVSPWISPNPLESYFSLLS